MSLIEADHVSFSQTVYDPNQEKDFEIEIIKGITLSIERGEFIGILGSNGSGKSTFAKLLCELLHPDEGKVLLNKVSLRETNLYEIRKNIGIVFQNPDNQIVGYLVEDDVGFALENLRFTHDEIWDRVDNSLKTMKLYDIRKRETNNLSGGQKQKVSIAGVLAVKPKCIILDEPTSMIDPIGREEIIEHITYLNHNKNISIILITHNMEEVLKADKVIVIDNGKIVLEGTPKSIFQKINVIQKYNLDVPQIKLLVHDLIKEGIPLPTDIFTAEELVEKLCQLKS